MDPGTPAPKPGPSAAAFTTSTDDTPDAPQTADQQQADVPETEIPTKSKRGYTLRLAHPGEPDFEDAVATLPQAMQQRMQELFRARFKHLEIIEETTSDTLDVPSDIPMDEDFSEID